VFLKEAEETEQMQELEYMGGIALTQLGPQDGGNFEHHWSGDYLQAHVLSDVGKKRAHNEDTCLICAPEEASLARDRGVLFAVADGMGGASGGEFASRLALEVVADEYYTGPYHNIPARLQDAFEQANRRVYEESEINPKYYGMGTTVSAVVIVGNCVYIAQVGDSRVYISRGKGNLLQVTDDHSLVAEQVRNGYLTEEEARGHTLKNLITRAVGIKEALKVDLFTFRIKPNDTLLVCSDGLSNMVDDETIRRGTEYDSLQGAARVLVGRALENGGTDNVSVILVRVTGVPPRVPCDEGAREVVVGQSGILGKLRRIVS